MRHGGGVRQRLPRRGDLARATGWRGGQRTVPGRGQPAAADRAAPAVTGFFIAIEGPNAVGKTTITDRLAAALRARGAAVHVTTEPSATPLGRLVRSAESHLSGRALALAVAADRYAHLEAEVTPALGAGKVVITDRYVQ